MSADALVGGRGKGILPMLTSVVLTVGLIVVIRYILMCIVCSGWTCALIFLIASTFVVLQRLAMITVYQSPTTEEWLLINFDYHSNMKLKQTSKSFYMYFVGLSSAGACIV